MENVLNQLIKIETTRNWCLTIDNREDLNDETQCPVCHNLYQENAFLITTSCPGGAHTFHYVCFLECMHERRR